MDKTLTKNISNKQNLASIAIFSEYPTCNINGEEAIKILKTADDNGNFDLSPYGKGRVFNITYGQLSKDGTIFGSPQPEDLFFPDFVKLGRPLAISVERTEIYKNIG